MVSFQLVRSAMSYLETSWYEGYYAGGARGRREPVRESAAPSSSSSSSSPNSSPSSSSWLVWVVQSVLAGISAGICYHVLHERKNGSYNIIDVSTVLSDNQQLVLFKSHLTKCWDRTIETLTRIPRWFWISAPAYVTLLGTGKYKCNGFLYAALFCGGNMYYWEWHCRNKESAGDDVDSTRETVGTSTKEKSCAVDPALAERDNRVTLKEELESLATSDNSVEKEKSRSRSNMVDTGNKSTAKRKGQPQQYLELMVHNVSHSDLVLSLESPDECAVDTTQSEIYIRPRFSCFDKYSRLVSDHIQRKDDEVIFFPRYQRSMEDPRYAIQPFPRDWDPPTAPTGFRLSHPAPVDRDTLQQDVRVRGTDQSQLASLMKDPHFTPQIRHVYFPLLASLLPSWERQIMDTRYIQPVKRVLILVTGVGTPRNWTHPVTGNSTQVCADLIEAFLARIDPFLAVIKVHSDTNIFRYDENLIFVERELMPTIHAYRDAHATGSPYPDELPSWERSTKLIETNKTVNFEDCDWRNSMNVILSFADGSPARTHAIQASVRPYRPMYFHFWRLKTFWHESKVVDDDIEVHSFETMNALPAVDVERVTDENIQAVIREMRSFYTEMAVALSKNSNDIRRFWLRKTQKPVLAVLLVQSVDMDKPQLFRGTNMEVSMPTGSLCAERSAIGSALAANPNLKRHELKLIAVLAVPSIEPTLDSKDDSVSIRRTSSYSSLHVVDDSSEHGERRKGRSRNTSLGSEYEPYTTNTEEWILPVPDQHLDTSMCGGSKLDDFEIATEPLRRISLFSKSTVPSDRKSKRTVVVHSHKDINPLSPCGACNEWLKKIAESNPYFKIVTFTDANCNGIYVSPCQE